MAKPKDLPDDQSRQFGERLFALREAAGITQEALALECGVTKGVMPQYEKGHTYPSMTTFVLMCTLLRTSADYLLFGSQSDPQFSPDVLRVARWLENMPADRRNALVSAFGPAIQDAEVESRMPITAKPPTPGPGGRARSSKT